MKDLTFTGQGLDNQVVIRVDAINADNGTQVSVVETYGLNDRKPSVVDKVAEKDLSAFQKINYPLQAFINVAVKHNLRLVIANTDGTALKVLNTVTVPAG